MAMLSVVVALLVCVDATRVKRADDRPELEAVVNQLSERLTQTTAQLTALQGQVSQLTARFRMYACISTRVNADLRKDDDNDDDVDGGGNGGGRRYHVCLLRKEFGG